MVMSGRTGDGGRSGDDGTMGEDVGTPRRRLDSSTTAGLAGLAGQAGLADEDI